MIIKKRIVYIIVIWFALAVPVIAQDVLSTPMGDGQHTLDPNAPIRPLYNMLLFSYDASGMIVSITPSNAPVGPTMSPARLRQVFSVTADADWKQVKITFPTKDDDQPYRLFIYNTQGMLVETALCEESPLLLNLSRLSKGVYIFSLGEKRAMTRKAFKSK